jgi:hypothetical protein
VVKIAINDSNLVLGPATLYVASYPAAEPQDATVTPNGYLTPPGTPWVDVGATDGGVTFEVDNTYTDLAADQVTMAVGSRLTESKMQVTAKLSEMTFTNLQTAINNIGVTASGTGWQSMEIPVGTASTQPSYMALIVDGWAPMTTGGTPALRRIIVRKVLSQVKASFTFDRKTQQSLDCTFTCYYVSGTQNPVHLVDELV